MPSKKRELQLTWPWTVYSENWWRKGTTRGVRMQRFAEAKRQRKTARLMMQSAITKGWIPEGPPWTIDLCRIIPPRGKAYHDENLVGGVKPIRDGIADAFKLDDGGPAFVWTYSQDRGVQGAIRVTITRIEG